MPLPSILESLLPDNFEGALLSMAYTSVLVCCVLPVHDEINTNIDSKEASRNFYNNFISYIPFCTCLYVMVSVYTFYKDIGIDIYVYPYIVLPN